MKFYIECGKFQTIIGAEDSKNAILRSFRLMGEKLLKKHELHISSIIKVSEQGFEFHNHDVLYDIQRLLRDDPSQTLNLLINTDELNSEVYLDKIQVLQNDEVTADTYRLMLDSDKNDDLSADYC